MRRSWMLAVGMQGMLEMRIAVNNFVKCESSIVGILMPKRHSKQ